MKLCIAEKPSVGREIAKILGATTQRNGYMEGNGYYVSWTFGHLCSLFEPNDYTDDWKAWRLEYLPMLPPLFKIKVVDNEGIKRQFEILRDLINRSKEVINCGDAGQEGELIQRWVLQKANCKLKVSRLWISSLTEDAIKEGFEKLYSSKDFDNLYAAGSARAIGDWLLGMNATRAYTLRFGAAKQVVSIGRVQTPTLAILVERQKAIDNFVSQKFWELKTIYKGGMFNSTKGRFAIKEDAEKILKDISETDLKITKVEEKKSKEHPPKLFDLTSLQIECNKKFGFSAEETLGLIQSLYEKKLTSYPRVDTNFLPDDVYKKAENILKSLTPYANYTQNLLNNLPLRKSKKVFNNSKITDHHAIIPTGDFSAARALSKNEKQVLDIIIRRFIAAFYPDCVIANTNVFAKVGEFDFKASGKQIILTAWRVLFETKTSNKEDGEKDITESKPNNEDLTNDENILPNYVVGESGPHAPNIIEKQTQAPKYMTEGDLLRAMETAGKQVEQEDLRALMKENGIGRPSTRASIIETLFKRGYICKEKKRILPTKLGMALIDNIPNELLKSAELTGKWEKKLKMISEGEYNISEFMQELKDMVKEVVREVRELKFVERFKIEENSNN